MTSSFKYILIIAYDKLLLFQAFVKIQETVLMTKSAFKELVE